MKATHAEAALFTLGEEWVAHEGTDWQWMPKAEAPPAPPSRGRMTVVDMTPTTLTFDAPERDIISFSASDMNLRGAEVGEVWRAEFDGRTLQLVVGERESTSGAVRVVAVEGDLIRVQWEPDPPRAPSEEPRMSRRERRAAKAKARRAR